MIKKTKSKHKYNIGDTVYLPALSADDLHAISIAERHHHRIREGYYKISEVDRKDLDDLEYCLSMSNCWWFPEYMLQGSANKNTLSDDRPYYELVAETARGD